MNSKFEFWWTSEHNQHTFIAAADHKQVAKEAWNAGVRAALKSQLDAMETLIEEVRKKDEGSN